MAAGVGVYRKRLRITLGMAGCWLVFAIAFGVVGALTGINGLIGVTLGIIMVVVSSLMGIYWASKIRAPNRVDL